MRFLFRSMHSDAPGFILSHFRVLHNALPICGSILHVCVVSEAFCLEYCLTVSIGESSSFPLFRRILTFFGVFVVLFTSSSMCGKSQFPLDASMWPPRQSITSMLRFASPMPRYVPVLSMSLIPAVSALLDTFEASAQALDMSALPFKMSAPHPGLFPLSACQCMPPCPA